MQFSVIRMHSSSTAVRWVRAAAVVSAVGLAALGTGSALLLVLRDAIHALRSPGRVSVDELVVAASAAGALGILFWVVLGLALSVVAALPGPVGINDRFVDAVAPAAIRRCAAILLGVSVVTGGVPMAAMAHESVAVATADAPAAPAPAPAPAPDWVPSVPEAGPAAPAPDWVPTPVRALPSVTLTTPRHSATDGEVREVTVRRGDTLWDIAAAHLSADATDAEIADEWQRWFQANRSVIGPDPDLILPGQVLRVPDSSGAGR
jgi:hypothetical protein